jgi:hypothetical protein
MGNTILDIYNSYRMRTAVDHPSMSPYQMLKVMWKPFISGPMTDENPGNF